MVGREDNWKRQIMQGKIYGERVKTRPQFVETKQYMSPWVNDASAACDVSLLSKYKSRLIVRENIG